MDTERPGPGPEPVYRWRVKLRRDSEPMLVETKLEVPMHAVAECMGRAGISAFKSMTAYSVEQLDEDGYAIRKWH